MTALPPPHGVGPHLAMLGALISTGALTSASLTSALPALLALGASTIIAAGWVWARVRRHLAEQRLVLDAMVAEVRTSGPRPRWRSVCAGDTIDGWLIETIDPPDVVVTRGGARLQLVVCADAEARIPIPSRPQPHGGKR